MKKYWNWLYDPNTNTFSSNAGHIYKIFVSALTALLFIITALFLIFLKCNIVAIVSTFLLVACASFAGGASIGFLFGLPRAQKNQPKKEENCDDSYSDNTNLEEVSDWLTKIIVGLTLIKFNKIIDLINNAALSMEKAFKGSCNCETAFFNAYVFSYCTIVLFFLAGAGLCYLWARTNLSEIFAKARKAQHDAEAKTERAVYQIQAMANTELKPLDDASESFRTLIESVYHSKPVFDKTDLQRGRWGGEPKRNDYLLEANYIPEQSLSAVNVFKVQLTIKSLKLDRPLESEVAFFLHDTFSSQIVYAKASNNRAEINFWAYEAFVVGARLEDKTELELDLNNVKVFPDGFYWKE